jgi:hypothetical protein
MPLYPYSPGSGYISFMDHTAYWEKRVLDGEMCIVSLFFYFIFLVLATYLAWFDPGWQSHSSRLGIGKEFRMNKVLHGKKIRSFFFFDWIGGGRRRWNPIGNFD